MRRVSFLVALALLAAIAAPSTAFAADCPGADLRPAADNIADVGQATLCLLNAERTARGLVALTEQQQLTQSSVAFSALMVEQHFFAHVSPDGGTLTSRLGASGYLARPGGWTVGENIAWGESYLASPAKIVQAWMDSPPHRENVLSTEFEEIGLGIVTGVPFSGNLGATYTTDFGRRDPVANPDETDDVQSNPAASGAKGEVRAAPRKRSSARRSQPRKSHNARGDRARNRSARQTKKARRALSMRAITAGVAR